jgi:predicted Zn finger-like uncharacterized protein
MTVSCPKCQQSYDLATIRLRGKDRTATCGKCGHRFVVQLLKPAPAAAAAAPPGSGTRAAPDAAERTIAGHPARQGGPVAAPHVRIALSVLEGNEKDRIYQISRSVTVIGRMEGEIRLADPKVSSRHAQVEIMDGEAWLRDLGSTNGTFVNGTRVDLARLKHLDEVTVGATRLLYTYIEDLVSAFEAFSPHA